MRQLQILQQCVLFVLPLSLFYSLLSVLFSTFCFYSTVFLIHAFSQISYLVPSSYNFVFIYSLSFDLSIYLSIQLFISSFVLQPVLNFPASYSLCITLTSSFHYIFFLIFHLLIICPLTFLVFPSVSFFLYTSFKRILCVALLRNRSVLMSIRYQFKCISAINTDSSCDFFDCTGYLQWIQNYHRKASSITEKPTERHTFLARFKLSIPEFGLLHLNSCFINPLNPELNPICYLLALLGAHHFLYVSRIRVKLLTFRLLMSYIYAASILDVSRSHTTTQHSR